MQFKTFHIAVAVAVVYMIFGLIYHRSCLFVAVE